MNNYEKYFEEVEDRAILISELIEEIIKIEDVLATHRKYGSSGIQYDQFVARRKEYSDRLNELLSPHQMKVVFNEAA
jgi:hypothetical protein